MSRSSSCSSEAAHSRRYLRVVLASIGVTVTNTGAHDLIVRPYDVLTSDIELCGGRVGEVFKDDPVTGMVRNRPGLTKLMAAARVSHQAGRTCYLLSYDTGRLARGEPWLRPMIEGELRRLGVQCAYVLKETDDSDEGMVLDGLRSLFDNWERKKIARRLADGRQHKLNRGALFHSKRPFGWVYRAVEELTRSGAGAGRHPKDGEVVHHPDEATTEEEIVRRIASGEMSAQGMAAERNRRGVRTTEGNGWVSERVEIYLNGRKRIIGALRRLRRRCV